MFALPGKPNFDSNLNNQQAQMYLKGVMSKEFVKFPVLPGSVSISKTSNWPEAIPMGRSDPFIAYSNSSSTIIGLSIQFYAVHNAGLDVMRPVNTLRSFMVPGVNGIPLPEVVQFMWGNAAAHVVVKNVSPQFKGPYTMPFNEPMQAEVSLELHQVFFNSDVIATDYLTKYDVFGAV
jgi:hypothetical protein